MTNFDKAQEAKIKASTALDRANRNLKKVVESKQYKNSDDAAHKEYKNMAAQYRNDVSSKKAIYEKAVKALKSVE